MRRLVGLWIGLYWVVMAGWLPGAFAQDYYPAHVGNWWVLRSTDQIDTKVNRITGQEMLRGRQVTVVESQTNDNPPDRFYVVTDANGVWILRAEGQFGNLHLEFNYDPPQPFVPTSLQLGTTWTVSGETSFLGAPVVLTNRAEVVALEDVTVPAGKFQNVFKIRQDIQLQTPLGILSFERFMWFAPNVGVIKEISTSGVVFELIDYEVVLETPIAVRATGKRPFLWASLKTGWH